MITCLDNMSVEKKLLSTEDFFRKSTFCTLMDANPGFDGHWVMPEIFLLNGTFTMLEMTGFFLKTFFQFHAFVQKYHVVVQYCQIGNFQSGTFAPMHGIEKSV